jgi:zinc and cadmium transporter
MNQLQSLALYTVAILVGALVGGTLPLLGRITRSDAMLSFSAGAMLGAAFFHMLPEAVEGGGAAVTPFVLVGFFVLYTVERFMLVHACAEPGMHFPAGAVQIALEGQPHAHAHPHPPARGDGTGCEVHTMGLAAFVGMSLHTVVDGFALGAASAQPELGLLVFLAILAHKIPNSFSLSTILRAEDYSRPRALLMNATFALMVPVGAGLYLLFHELVQVATFTSFALAASAGTFLHLSLSDILPDVHRRNGPRWRIVGSLLLGLAVMWALRLLHHGH